MKRQQDRETPPKGKRMRPNYMGNGENGRDRMTPDNDRRDVRGGKLMGREPKGYGRPDRDRERDRDFDMDPDRLPPKRHKDDRGMMMGEPFHGSHMSRALERQRLSNFGGEEYKNLKLTVNGPGPDSVVRDMIFKEFKKFGEFNLRIGYIGDNRVAYLNFRNAEDARDAKHARQNKLMLFDRPVRIDVVYENNKPRQRSASPDFGLARDSFSTRSASPPMPNMRRGGRQGNMGRKGGMGPRGDRNNQPNHNDYNINFDQRSQGSGRQGGQGPEWFPHHLSHILPEDDDKATRTLFVGNLDHSIQDEDLKQLFEHYGIVEDIDIKRPAKNQSNAYAFVKFINLDMAHRAKVEMSGQYIKGFECKIGYGKVSPSTCLWVGGLGPWIKTQTLETEFDRFGAIHRIVWPPGQNYAYVLYDSIDAAQAACQEMRGFHIGGSDKRLRVDFADEKHIDELPGLNSPRPLKADNFGDGNRYWDMGDRGRDIDDGWQDHKGDFGDRPNNRNRGNRKDSWHGPDRMDNFRNQENCGDVEFNRFHRDNMDHNDNFERQGRPPRGGFGNGNNRGYHGGRGRGGGGMHNHPHQNMDKNFMGRHERDPHNKHGNNIHEELPTNGKRHRHMSPMRGCDDANGQERLSQGRDPESARDLVHDVPLHHGHDERSLSRPMASVEHVDNIVDLAKCLPVVWSGALVLKNSAFAARMHIVSGAVNLVDTLMRDTTTTEMPVLRITQRLRLDQPKLEEVGRRVLTCGPNGHSVLLAKPGSVQAVEDSNTNSQIQQRPLKNLVSYLKQKEAAGVITLPPNPTKGRDSNTGVLYAFPPCQFGLDFLLKCAPKLKAEASSKEDHLVVVVVRAEG